MGDEIGRIFFPDNPWPSGHALKEFFWLARYVPKSGIWFDFHLESKDYDAEDVKGAVEEEEAEDLTDWTSKVLWYNYHRCILSSTRWAWEAEGADTGVLVGTKTKPLDLRMPLEFGCDGELGDPNDWPRPFAVYLLGHDAVADHRFRIEPSRERGRFSVEWTGKLALIYGGANAFEHTFRAVIPVTSFLGIRLPGASLNADMTEGVRECLAHPDDFEVVEDDGEVWLRMKRSVG